MGAVTRVALFCLGAAACAPSFDGYQYLGEAPRSEGASSVQTLARADGATLIAFRGRLQSEASFATASVHLVSLAEGRWTELAAEDMVVSEMWFAGSGADPVLATRPLAVPILWAAVAPTGAMADTVRFHRLRDGRWTVFAEHEVSEGEQIVFATADASGTPYVVRTVDGHTEVLRHDGAAFVRMGQPLEASAGLFWNEPSRLQFDPVGNAYFLWLSPDRLQLRVLTFGADGWTPLGEWLLPTEHIGNVVLELDRDGAPAIAFTGRGGIEVRRWREGEWQPLGPVIAPADPSHVPALRFDRDNRAHLTWRMDTKLRLSRLDGDTWRVLGEPLILVEPGIGPVQGDVSLSGDRPVVLWVETLPGPRLGPQELEPATTRLFAAEVSDEE